MEVDSPDSNIHEVARKLEKRDNGSVVVTDDKLVDLITDRDVAIRCIEEAHDPSSTTAEKVMSSEILYCRAAYRFYIFII